MNIKNNIGKKGVAQTVVSLAVVWMLVRQIQFEKESIGSCEI